MMYSGFLSGFLGLFGIVTGIISIAFMVMGFYALWLAIRALKKYLGE